ncbi:hypothetical protein EYF80_033998 [Liparis tanakae]|uniref:Uncharacterized protein n=1 Tax=Liparis tanakae TaxID=230148 RepID=A0A4Z2GQT3_9TELE|nr:hypothetical protein EYF80_033998 [Liparis tanakae]
MYSEAAPGTVKRPLVQSLASTTHTTSTFSTRRLLSLLGCTARRRFSIHLSLSAADRHEKHLVPVEVRIGADTHRASCVNAEGEGEGEEEEDEEDEEDEEEEEAEGEGEDDDDDDEKEEEEEEEEEEGGGLWIHVLLQR